MDPDDLRELGIKEGTNILVSTNNGSVILKALKSLRTPHRGIIYIPYGPWANVIVDPETQGVGMPSLKGIPAEVETVKDKPVLSLRELLKEQFGKN
jgi:formylmethanofuran dehydrogenase subunit D